MTLVMKSVSALLEELRSSAPTPGGGSASALAGALGSSLLAMVAGLPKPRAATPGELETLAQAGSRCTGHARRLEALVDEDSDAYQTVMRAYRLPKATADEQRARSAAIQAALQAAIDAPLAMMRACASALVEAPAIRALGNANASSDVGVAVELLRAAGRGARLNVEINLETVKDRAYADRVREDMDRLDLR